MATVPLDGKRTPRNPPISAPITQSKKKVTIHQQSWWLSEERHSRDAERRHVCAAMATFGTPGVAWSVRLGIAARQKITNSL